MKLHIIRASHNSRRVLATVAHLGLDVDVVEPEFTQGELKSPEFLALNPNGKAPVLQDGEFTLWESNAIMQYLADGTVLQAGDVKGRADVARWQFWESNHLSRGTATLTTERVFKPFVLKLPTDEAAVARGIAAFHPAAKVLNHHLEHHEFLVGGSLSIADFSVGCNFTYAGPGQFPLKEYPHVRAWLGRLDAIASWAGSAPKP